MLVNLGIIVLTFAGMELFSWAIHKYLMHGPLWNIHKTHHGHSKGRFELNDLFSVSFGTIAILLIILGKNELNAAFWIGIGISLYGLVYFILHDVLIHRRIKSNKKIRGKYLRALKNAHQAHHKSRDKEDSESFGLLWVASKYYRNKPQ